MMMYLIVGCLAFFIAAVVLIITMMASPKGLGGTEKKSPFECGFLSFEESRSPFSLQFFLVSLVFLMFDIEVVLLFPYMTDLAGVAVKPAGLLVFFLVCLTLGLFWEWGKALLEWQI